MGPGGSMVRAAINNSETKGSTGFRNLKALGCSIPSAALAA